MDNSIWSRASLLNFSLRFEFDQERNNTVTNLLTHFSCHASEIKDCVTNAMNYSHLNLISAAPQEFRVQKAGNLTTKDPTEPLNLNCV